MAKSALRIGTRGSRLATAQADMVARALRTTGTLCELVLVKTTGDQIQDRSLADAGGKGLFTKELEEALLAGSIDLAVHSMKDVPVVLPPELDLAAILEREQPNDVFISHKAASLRALPSGSTVGTSSVRRAAQVKRARPDLVPVLLRGNVDTRLKKLDENSMDAIILALAGLKRLGMADRVTEILPTDEWLPSLAQGAVGIEIREHDTQTRAAVSQLDHKPTATALACERAFQAALDGSCKTPIAGLAICDGTHLSFRGEVLAPDGSDFVATGFTNIKCGNSQETLASRECGAALKPRVAHWLPA